VHNGHFNSPNAHSMQGSHWPKQLASSTRLYLKSRL